METHLLYLEIGAILTGITVILIEAYIIYALNNHLKALEQHMDYLSEHSDEIEKMLRQICEHNIEIHDQNFKRLKKGSNSRFDVEIEHKVPTR